MISLSNLLKLQWIYAVTGVAYNVVSYVAVAGGGQQFSTTPPLKGGLSMTLFGVFLLAGHFRFLKLYRFLMAGAIIAYGYGGIVVHLFNYAHDPRMYVSFLAWLLAVGINVYGLGLNLLAVSGRFTHDKNRVFQSA